MLRESNDGYGDGAIGYGGLGDGWPGPLGYGGLNDPDYSSCYHKYERKTTKLPPLTQQPVLNIDGTPDEGYPLRILRAYRENCNCRWTTDTEGNCENIVFHQMNEDNRERAAILDRAIAVLEREKP